MATVFTVGHGTRATEELVDVLRSAGVEVLVYMDTDEFRNAVAELESEAESKAIAIDEEGWPAYDLGPLKLLDD